ncbi:uncharacterized protein LOC136040549 [Artemia franciscana]|uniref:uncharacterized protein LOC136040549 n=1 Tax=Artemia franciscana TaxID=6661 RepID=UPI0032DB6BDD
MFYNISFYDAKKEDLLNETSKHVEETIESKLRVFSCLAPLLINNFVCLFVPFTRIYYVKITTITNLNYTSTNAMPGGKGLQGDPGQPGGNGESILGGDSLDSLSFGSMMSFSNKGQMASKNQVFVQREMSPSPRLCRSNSMRSSKSDKIYSALIQRVEDMENVETMDSVMAQR